MNRSFFSLSSIYFLNQLSFLFLFSFCLDLHEFLSFFLHVICSSFSSSSQICCSIFLLPLSSFSFLNLNVLLSLPPTGFFFLLSFSFPPTQIFANEIGPDLHLPLSSLSFLQSQNVFFPLSFFSSSSFSLFVCFAVSFSSFFSLFPQLKCFLLSLSSFFQSNFFFLSKCFFFLFLLSHFLLTPTHSLPFSLASNSNFLFLLSSSKLLFFLSLPPTLLLSLVSSNVSSFSCLQLQIGSFLQLFLLPLSSFLSFILKLSSSFLKSNSSSSFFFLFPQLFVQIFLLPSFFFLFSFFEIETQTQLLSLASNFFLFLLPLSSSLSSNSKSSLLLLPIQMTKILLCSSSNLQKKKLQMFSSSSFLFFFLQKFFKIPP
ncbi:unnamed protein product [Acanthosepion pharaonis]|uniref:Uncharacterized protein n=1 Tax=Acanthosepion pharaonis TaxID=158019 RepID=A0A812AM29_ACAPH|nr:unnamed protein product [Sepia pharaonis]